MKKEFSGYYELDEKDVTRLWAGAVVVFDTNVLLHTYRVPKQTREQLLSILKKIKHRIWIPYQVGVEYQRNRINALREEFARSKGVVDDVKKSHAGFVRNVRDLDMKERGVGIEVEAELKQMEKSAAALIEHLKKGMDGYVAPGEKDHILDTLTTLFNGRVGPRPGGQEEVDALYAQAKLRYAAKMGPGYMDEAKAGDLYQADGIIYDRQFGDYLLWSQLLAYVQEQKLKDVIFVTSDVKEDWWLDTKSSSGVRPLPELCMEMRRKGGADRFWMYTLHEFMSESNKHLGANVTQQALDDVRLAEIESSERYLLGNLRSGWATSGDVTGDVNYRTSLQNALLAADEMGATIFENGRPDGACPVAQRTVDGSKEHLILIDLDAWQMSALSLSSLLIQYLGLTLSTTKRSVGVVCFGSYDGRLNGFRESARRVLDNVRKRLPELGSLTLLGIAEDRVLYRKDFSVGKS
jgi:hypothetical protein